MAGKSRFSVAEKQIKSFFLESPLKAYTRKQLEQIFVDNHEHWYLPVTSGSKQFIEQLLKSGILSLSKFDFDGYIGKKELYLTARAEVFDVAVALFSKSYLSHYTAAFIHQLTNQVPKSVYVTFEQSKKLHRSQTNELLQKNIDEAFSKPQRKTGAKAAYNGYAIVAHNGMYTGRTGVYQENGIYVTNIERTLIDLAVRPNYGGGVHEVLKAYESAKNRVSINKLIAILNTIDFTYPYSQVIGFYLERAKYDQKFLEALRKRVSKYNFYLTYDMKDTAFSEEWKLYYPKGM